MKYCLRLALLIAAGFAPAPAILAAEAAATMQLHWSFGAVQAPRAGLALGVIAQAPQGTPTHALALTGMRWQQGIGATPVVLGVSPAHVQALQADEGETGKRAKWPWITAVSIVGGIALASLIDSSEDGETNVDGSSSGEERCNIASTNGDGDVTVVSESCVP